MEQRDVSTQILPSTVPTPDACWRWLGRNGWALADQVLISGSNFATMLLAARGMMRGEFGAFTLVYSGLLFANILQWTLITQPHNVLGTGRHRGEYGCFTSSSAVAQLFLLAMLAIPALGMTALAYAAGWGVAPLLLAATPAVVAWQGQEFVRRVLYTEARFAAAFANDLLSYGGQTVVVAVLFWGGRLTGPTALYAVAGASLVATGLGVWRIRRSLRWEFSGAMVRESWEFGKWLAGAEILGWCSSLQIYMLIAAAMLGTVAAGELKAVQILFGPTRVLSFFLVSVLPMQYARALVTGGREAVHRQLRIVYGIVGPVLGCYCLVVGIFAKPLLHLSYGDKYASDSGLLALYAVSDFLMGMEMILSAALSAKRLTRHIFIGYVYRFAVALPLSWLFIRAFGLKGVLLDLILMSLIVIGVFWRVYRRDLTQAPAAAPKVEKVEEEVVCP